MMKSKRPEFMGYGVSIPQYMRLVNLQDAVVELDRYMKVLAIRFGPKILKNDQSWKELVKIYHSLKSLLPQEVRDENKDVVFWA